MLKLPSIFSLFSRSSRAYADLLCDGVVYGFAFWTVLCHAVVFAGGSLHHLLVVTGLCLVACLVGWRYSRARRTTSVQEQASPSSFLLRPEDAPFTVGKYARGWVLAAAIIAVMIYVLTSNLVVYWLIALVVLFFTSLHGLTGRFTNSVSAPTRQLSWELILWVLGVIGAIVTLIAHRPNLDDGGYLHIVISVIDAPDLPILARDSLHGLPELPPLFQVYKVHSLEIFEGALAYLTGLHGLDVAYWIIPTLAGLLVPLAYARLFRRLIPGRWIWGVLIVVLFLFSVADSKWIYSNFAFVRLHQGKAIFLSVLVPLLMAYGLEFAQKPSKIRGFRLLAGQVAAVGLTSTALWMAPLVVGLAIVCGIQRHRRPLHTLLLGAFSSLYVLLLALWMKLSFQGVVDNTTEKASIDLMSESLQRVLGQDLFLFLGLFLLIAGWAFAQTSAERRFMAIFPLGFLFLWNPFVGHFLAENLTHPVTYWRVFWILPFPSLLGVALSVPIEMPLLRKVPAWGRSLLTLGMVGLLFFGGTKVHVLSSANEVRLGVPTWKVPQETFSIVCTMAEQVPPGSIVLAPFEVSGWIPILHGHPMPLVARRHYMDLVEESLGVEEVEQRLRLTRHVSGIVQTPATPRVIARGIENYPLVAVALARSASTVDVRAVLRAARFIRTVQSQHFEVWSSADALPEGQPADQRWRDCRKTFLFP